jgi:hypothetical protein
MEWEKEVFETSVMLSLPKHLCHFIQTVQ